MARICGAALETASHFWGIGGGMTSCLGFAITRTLTHPFSVIRVRRLPHTASCLNFGFRVGSSGHLPALQPHLIAL